MKETRFKNTEIGPIPADWEVMAVEDVLTIGNGRDYKHLKYGSVPVYGTGGLMCFVDDFLYDGPTVCIGRKGTIDVPQYHEGKIWTVDTLFYTHSFQNVLPRFIYYIFHRIDWLSHNEASGVPSLTSFNIGKITLPIPAIEEQKRILEALSDVDALIQELGELIEKKRLIKQGAMQQLLSGKTRLPGFSKPWRECNIGKDTIVKARIGWQGLTSDEYLDSGTYYLVGGTDFCNGRINWANCKYVSKERFEQDSNIQIKEKDCLITKDGTIGKVAFIQDKPGFGTLNSGVFVIRSKNESLSQEFLSLIFLSQIFSKFMDELVAGSTILHLYQKDIVKFSFMIPSDIEEQKDIVLILSDMDNEIAELESKREKYQSLKQGMMQELLTGRIRLVEPSVSNDLKTYCHEPSVTHVAAEP